MVLVRTRNVVVGSIVACPRGVTIVTRRNLVAAGAVMALLMWGNVVISPTSAASNTTQGITATTIRIGISYVDVDAAPLRADGLNMNWGSVPNAFNAVTDNMNAHGGINGRKMVPYIVAVNPVGTAPAATACTQLTEDDSVFAVITPLEATCYLQHNTPGRAWSSPAPTWRCSPTSPRRQGRT
jgi:hypothetical protein